MLIVDGNYRQPLPPADMARKGLEVGDDQIDLPLIYEILQARDTGRGAPCAKKISSDGAAIAHLVIDVRDPPPVNFRDFEVLAQVGQPAIKRNDVDIVPGALQVRNHLFRPRRVPRTLAIYAIQDVRHAVRKV